MRPLVCWDEIPSIIVYENVTSSLNIHASAECPTYFVIRF